jgi:hypothetical protein
MPRKYYLRYLQLPRRSRVRNYSAIVLLARTNLPNLIVRGTLDIQDYDDGDMQCRRMFCRHTVWDDLRGVCHLFLSDHTCASLDYDFSPCRLAGRFHVQTLYAGMNAILHLRFRSHITITASEASRLHYTPKLLGPRPWAERMVWSVNWILPMCRYWILRPEHP